MNVPRCKFCHKFNKFCFQTTFILISWLIQLEFIQNQTRQYEKHV